MTLVPHVESMDGFKEEPGGVKMVFSSVTPQEEIIIPTVHMNGTGAQDLFDQVKDAHNAVSLARCKLREAFPNGRDYYVQGPDALPKAIKQWEARLNAIRQVEDDLMHIGIALSEHI